MIKIMSAGVVLLSVPIILGLLGLEKYGVWAALTSVISWIILFDFGAGVTVKNSVSRAVGSNSYEGVTDEVIKTVRFLSISSIFLILVFLVFTYYFDFFKENKKLALTLIIPFIIAYPITIGSMILQGARKFYLNSVLLLIPQIVFLLTAYIYHELDLDLSLQQLAVIYVLINISSMVVIWCVSLKVLKFKFVYFRKLLEGPILFGRLKTAFRFFVLQLSSLFLYSMGTILTIENLTPTDAAYYDIVSKVYLFGLTLFNVAVSVFWSEFVIYIESKNYTKMMRSYGIFIVIASLFSAGAFGFSFFSPLIISLWTSGSVSIEQNVAMTFALLVSIQAISYCGAAVLNAFEEISFQMVMSITAAALMIPVSTLLFSMEYGVSSVPIATIALSIPALFYCNVKAFFLIRRSGHAQ